MEKKQTDCVKYLDTLNTFCLCSYGLMKFRIAQNDSRRSQYQYKFRSIKKIIHLISRKIGYTKGFSKEDS